MQRRLVYRAGGGGKAGFAGGVLELVAVVMVVVVGGGYGMGSDGKKTRRVCAGAV
jgi:hypothetical protein